jgi:hypothetical protein
MVLVGENPVSRRRDRSCKPSASVSWTRLSAAVNRKDPREEELPEGAPTPRQFRHSPDWKGDLPPRNSHSLAPVEPI